MTETDPDIYNRFRSDPFLRTCSGSPAVTPCCYRILTFSPEHPVTDLHLHLYLHLQPDIFHSHMTKSFHYMETWGELVLLGIDPDL